MTRLTSYALAAALLTVPFAAFAQTDDMAAPAPAPAPAAAAHPSAFAHMLKLMDGNGDGKISSAEFQAAAAKRFDAADVQHSGQVTAEQLANSPAARDHAGKMAEHEVKKFGSNGVITRDQYLAAAQSHFAKLDKNGDGFITEDEMPAGHAGKHKPAAAKAQ